MKVIEGYTFDECLEMASVADIENVNFSFLPINQLIENKNIVNRPKDQIDGSSGFLAILRFIFQNEY